MDSALEPADDDCSGGLCSAKRESEQRPQTRQRCDACPRNCSLTIATTGPGFDFCAFNTGNSLTLTANHGGCEFCACDTHAATEQNPDSHADAIADANTNTLLDLNAARQCNGACAANQPHHPYYAGSGRCGAGGVCKHMVFHPTAPAILPEQSA